MAREEKQHKQAVELIQDQNIELKCACTDIEGSYISATYYGANILLCRKCMDKMFVALVGNDAEQWIKYLSDMVEPGRDNSEEMQIEARDATYTLSYEPVAFEYDECYWHDRHCIEVNKHLTKGLFVVPSKSFNVEKWEDDLIFALYYKTKSERTGNIVGNDAEQWIKYSSDKVDSAEIIAKKFNEYWSNQWLEKKSET